MSVFNRSFSTYKNSRSATPENFSIMMSEAKKFKKKISKGRKSVNFVGPVIPKRKSSVRITLDGKQ